MTKVAGFVLTGGQSTRMGQDKALLPVGTQTLCEHLGDVVAQLAEQVLLIGHPERYAHLKYRCIADIRPGLGPLSGLETALSLEIAEWNIITSCDAWNLNADWLRTLLAQAQLSHALCTVAQDDSGKLQPLCGVYHHSGHAIVKNALSEGRLRAMDLLTELAAIPVRIPAALLNLNTPEQYEKLIHAGRI